MNGFEIGERVDVVSFCREDLEQPVSGILVEFVEKTSPRNEVYEGNPYTHWAIVRIDVYKAQELFVVKIGEEWPAQFSEIKHHKKEEINEAAK